MYKLSALELHNRFVTGALSAVQIAEYFLKRAKNHNSSTGAFLNFLETRALKKAATLDQKKKSNLPYGRLAGIPIAIKDNLHIQGEKTTCASKFMENYKALFDATSVKLLEDEGAIVLGKTNLDEFAMGSTTEFSAFQKTKNPWNLDCTPGGSSGGSAACVASRCALFALGSDTGGSIRQPAAFTGIVGFKPTYGRVSRYGLVAFGSSLDQVGPLATCVEDTALVMEVIGKHCSRDSTSSMHPVEPYLQSLKQEIKGKRIGVPWKFLDNLSPAMKQSFESTLQVYLRMGFSIVDIHLEELSHSIPLYYIIAPAEASVNLARFDGVLFSKRSEKARTLEEIYTLSKEEGFGPEVKRRILLGTFVLSSGFQNDYYKKAVRVREMLIQRFADVFKQCDVIATPTSPSEAFPLGSISDPVQLYLQDLYTISANLAGLPAISIPCGFSENGLPIGFQLMGPSFADARVLQMAYLFQMEHNYHQKIPLLFDQEV